MITRKFWEEGIPFPTLVWNRFLCWEPVSRLLTALAVLQGASVAYRLTVYGSVYLNPKTSARIVSCQFHGPEMGRAAVEIS